MAPTAQARAERRSATLQQKQPGLRLSAAAALFLLQSSRAGDRVTAHLLRPFTGEGAVSCSYGTPSPSGHVADQALLLRAPGGKSVKERTPGTPSVTSGRYERAMPQRSQSINPTPSNRYRAQMKLPPASGPLHPARASRSAAPHRSTVPRQTSNSIARDAAQKAIHRNYVISDLRGRLFQVLAYS